VVVESDFVAIEASGNRKIWTRQTFCIIVRGVQGGHIKFDVSHVPNTTGVGRPYSEMLTYKRLKPFVTRGQYFHFWIKNVPVLKGIFCQDKMLDYAYN
jgi:hypothetical protein